MHATEIKTVLLPKHIKNIKFLPRHPKQLRETGLSREKKWKYVEIKGVHLLQCFAEEVSPTSLPLSYCTLSRYFESRCLRDSLTCEMQVRWTGQCKKNTPSLSHMQSLQKQCPFNTKSDQILNEEWDQDRMDNWFGKKACKS